EGVKQKRQRWSMCRTIQSAPPLPNRSPERPPPDRRRKDQRQGGAPRSTAVNHSEKRNRPPQKAQMGSTLPAKGKCRSPAVKGEESQPRREAHRPVRRNPKSPRRGANRPPRPRFRPRPPRRR